MNAAGWTSGPMRGMLDQQCGKLERIDDQPAGEVADQLICSCSRAVGKVKVR